MAAEVVTSRRLLARHAVVRRPSGDKPPLPRSVHRVAWLLLGAAAALTALWAALAASLGLDSWMGRLEDSTLQALVDLRGDAINDVARVVSALDHRTTVVIATALVLLALAVLKRLQRILVLGGALLVALAITALIQTALDQPRPLGVEILGSWEGPGGMNEGMTQLAVVLVGGLVSLVPAGRARHLGAVAIAGLVVLVALADGLLATDYVVVTLASAAVGAIVTLAAFWLFAPDEVYPVAIRRGRSAHLDLGGARGAAIRRAVADQLGLDVVEIKPFGLAGSAGSSPMRLTVASGEHLFAKLFAQQHVRADRMYKLTRSMLYGRLEDERPYQSARRLAEFEDYTLRVFRDAGVPVVASYGIVELTPEREYMLVTEFAAGAREIGDPEVEVTPSVIDAGLTTVRRLWDAGLAHRDIKPANVLVRDGGIVLIDTGFSAVRPSPWRQAVDLANMMLCLALRTDAATVYEHAKRQFTEAEIAEAFAASHGPTIPSQLKAMLKADGRDLLGQFRALAPPRPPIPIQRWSLYRIALIVATVVGVVVTAVAAWIVFFGLAPDEVAVPRCPDTTPVLLGGQAVPEAAFVPCVAAVPAEWSEITTTVSDGELTMDVVLRGPDDEAGSLRLQLLPSERCPATGPDVQSFEGGCVVQTATLPVDPDVIELVPRAELDAAAQELTGGWAEVLTEP